MADKFLIMITVLTFGSAGAMAQISSAPASQDALEPASLPAATASAPSSPPDTSPLPKAATVSEGLKLDWAENQILDSIRDGDGRINDNGLYVLLRRAAALPELSQPQYEKLSQISADSLLESPRRFRALPMRLTMGVYRVRKWEAGTFQVTSRWPKDRPVWWIGGLDFTGRSPSKRQIIVLSIVDPTPALGTPDKVLPDGELTFPDGRHLEVAGVFYKVYQASSVGSENRPPTLTDYPVVVAWQVGRSTRFSDNFDWLSAAAFVSLAVLIILFFVFRRRVSQMKKETPQVGRGNYRPLRDGEQPAPPPPAEPDGEVDPLLREAAERFRKEKPNG